MNNGTISNTEPFREGMETLLRKVKPISIAYYRTVTADRAIIGRFPSIEGSIISGGRFNIPGQFGALYLSTNPQTALEEAIQTTRRAGFQEWKPKTIVEIKFQDILLLNLENRNNLEQIQIDSKELEIDWNEENKHGRIAPSQLVGKIARDCGFEAILVRSQLIREAYNVAVFLEKIPDGNIIITCEDRLPVGHR